MLSSYATRSMQGFQCVEALQMQGILMKANVFFHTKYYQWTCHITFLY